MAAEGDAPNPERGREKLRERRAELEALADSDNPAAPVAERYLRLLEEGKGDAR